MKKILIIEDERVLAEMYKDKFEMAGFEVFLAFDCKEGIKLAKEKNPDLILLDILLPIPTEDGISFLKNWKSDPKISKIPIIAFSNYDDPKVKNEAIELGVKEYLLKTNFTPQQIVEKVKEYLK
jgi:DNA-binding response OmpR family regulator